MENRNRFIAGGIKIIMKIYVYAIAKNEEKFALRWAESMSEADGVFVLDTGSDDNTAEILRNNGVTVISKRITPWRFDEARNSALDMVPEDADLCISTDLDEVFLKGWREKICTALKNTGANLMSCYYAWSQNENGGDGITFFIKKMHARHGFRWRGIVHEVITPTPGTTVIEAVAEGVKLIHLPDDSKSRAQYLPLLIQAVEEEPLNDRNSFYLGREYFFRGMYDKAVSELSRHLALPTAMWDEERSASRRYLAKAEVFLGNKEQALKNFLLSAGEYPFSREPWIALGEFLYGAEDWHGTVWAMRKALEINNPSASYLNEPKSFSSFPYDILSIACYKTGDTVSALDYAKKALALAPDDARIRANTEFFEKTLTSEKIGR